MFVMRGEYAGAVVEVGWESGRIHGDPFAVAEFRRQAFLGRTAALFPEGPYLPIVEGDEQAAFAAFLNILEEARIVTMGDGNPLRFQWRDVPRADAVY